MVNIKMYRGLGRGGGGGNMTGSDGIRLVVVIVVRAQGSKLDGGDKNKQDWLILASFFAGAKPRWGIFMPPLVHHCNA